jgi:hypothetical protein
MTSATTQASGARRRHVEGQGYGLVPFAAVLVAIIGCVSLVDGSRQNLAAAQRAGSVP